VAPDEFIHIAGSGVDAGGARQFGIFSGLLYDNPPVSGPQPCFRLNSISELPAKFGL